jgi:hypothetical protein
MSNKILVIFNPKPRCGIRVFDVKLVKLNDFLILGILNGLYALELTFLT